MFQLACISPGASFPDLGSKEGLLLPQCPARRSPPWGRITWAAQGGDGRGEGCATGEFEGGARAGGGAMALPVLSPFLRPMLLFGPGFQHPGSPPNSAHYRRLLREPHHGPRSSWTDTHVRARPVLGSAAQPAPARGDAKHGALRIPYKRPIPGSSFMPPLSSSSIPLASTSSCPRCIEQPSASRVRQLGHTSVAVYSLPLFASSLLLL